VFSEWVGTGCGGQAHSKHLGWAAHEREFHYYKTERRETGYSTPLLPTRTALLKVGSNQYDL
jgi:hypothetical protein